jgi:3-oxoacyl-(acyl-carrier-protein) synthase
MKTTLPKTISITAFASISGLGNDPNSIWQNYLNDNHCFTETTINNQNTFISPLNSDSKKQISELKKSDNKYKSLDNSVLFAIAASRKAIEKAGWKNGDNFGINIGSSRGATELFEKYHLDFIQSGKAEPLASPTTTLGNISSWVSHDLQSQGPEISHSITCSTALHALLNGVAWLKSGMADKFLIGGSEAPLTDFTIAQMRALKIYSKNNDEFPCRALDLNKKQNSLVLGEGAAVCCLEIGRTEKTIAIIEGIGYATEILEHNVSVSAEATCFQKSMKMALENTKLLDVDAIVMHAPGTIKGDLSEYKAIQKTFGEELPLLTSNKWKIGHTFGASGLLSIEMAILMLQNQTFIGVPFAEAKTQKKPLKKILVNAVGFGGNAVSVLLSL